MSLLSAQGDLNRLKEKQKPLNTFVVGETARDISWYVEYEKRAGIARKQEGSVATSYEFKCSGACCFTLNPYISLSGGIYCDGAPCRGNHAAERSPGVCSLFLCCKFSFGSLPRHFLCEMKSWFATHVHKSKFFFLAAFENGTMFGFFCSTE